MKIEQKVSRGLARELGVTITRARQLIQSHGFEPPLTPDQVRELANRRKLRGRPPTNTREVAMKIGIAYTTLLSLKSEHGFLGNLDPEQIEILIQEREQRISTR